mmetsp:Transcript_1973/g.3078  ORF Transcript_1973/g.3078 Transcript_1973/m.3078 type:complete len:528 (-) Transcript_1973:591-2174(-)|eukprot:CAMPEP_0119005768 /NCGR_PEP_ID=MMETSP1176-20130426/1914_1 /TAXON_ID=265551 /ORGANISM="Synedropsis recta cf, Strain CCMP1620" /LENGTH=527 /DNA_ID=CAMNT_0006957609 /DNA_START=114 /DNA_END=1697 /DNA_ORIENTATION=+
MMDFFMSHLLPYLLTAVGTFFVSLILVYGWVRPKYVDPKVPGPKRHFLLGITFGDLSDFFEDGLFGSHKWPTLTLLLSRQFDFQTWGGPTINLGFGTGGAFFNVVSPACLQYILRDNFDNYEKGKLTKSFQELVGNAAFTTDGEAWRCHRKIVVATLNRDTVKYGAHVLVDKLEQIEGLLDKKSDADQVFDFQDLSYRMLLDVFVKIGFGFDLNGIGSDDHAVPFVDAFNEMQLLIHERFNDFSWEFKQRFVIGKREKRVKHCGQIIDDFADEIISATRSRENQDRPDIVSSYLRYCEEQGEPTPTNQQLRDLVISMVVAGRDTTAAALTWTVYELTKHPAAVQRIREEVDQVCRGRELSFELVHKLPYTHAVVMESLRLHPPVPDTFRFSKNADVLPDGTRIPAGVLVMYSINSINNSEKVWKDPETFNPNRFFDDPLEPSQFKFPTFNAGPRVCPGQSLSMMKLKLCLAYLLPRYDFLDAENHSGDFLWTLVMSMKGGFHVKARKRIETKGTLGLHRSRECFKNM